MKFVVVPFSFIVVSKLSVTLVASVVSVRNVISVPVTSVFDKVEFGLISVVVKSLLEGISGVVEFVAS